MRICILTCLMLCISTLSFAQVGIGTDNPKSTLDVSLPANYTTGTPAGVSAPRATAAQIEGMITTALPAGTIIWSTTATGTTVNAVGFWYWNESTWTPLSGGGGAADGNGIYDDNGTITTARTVTLGGGDLTFNGDNIVEGNDVIIGSNSALRTQGARYKGTRLQGGIVNLGNESINTDDEVYVLNSTHAFGDVNLILPDPSINEGRVLTVVNSGVTDAIINLNSLLIGGSLVAISSSNFNGITAGYQIVPGEAYTFIVADGKWHVQSNNGQRTFRKMSPLIPPNSYALKPDDDVVIIDNNEDFAPPPAPVFRYSMPLCSAVNNGKMYTMVSKGTNVIGWDLTNNVSPVVSITTLWAEEALDVMCVYADGVGEWRFIGQL